VLGTSDYQHFDRVNWGKFFKHHPDPPDVLVVRVPTDPELQSEWENRFLDQPLGKKPKYLMVVEQAGDLLRSHSSIYRAWLKCFERVGYEGVLKHLDSSSCGSPAWGSFFVTIHYLKMLQIDDNLALKLVGDLELLPRGFKNCLKPVGIPRNLWTPRAWRCHNVEIPQRDNHIGHIWQHPVVDPLGPALLDPNMLVFLPGDTRRLDPEEWTKIKGLPKLWRPGSKSIRGILENMGAHKWSALGDFVSHLEASCAPVAAPFPGAVVSVPLEPAGAAPEVKLTNDGMAGWAWEPPDLGPDSDFYHRQRSRLREVTAELRAPLTGLTRERPP
jgi:hypothetical protein